MFVLQNRIFYSLFIFLWKYLFLEQHSASEYTFSEVRCMKCKKTVSRILRMSPRAWEFQIRSLQLSCLLLLCAIFLLIRFQDSMGAYSLYILSGAFQEYAQLALLMGGIIPLCLEDLR